MIYADNAATTKLCIAAYTAMIPYLTDLYGNPSSPHELGRLSSKAISKARADIAGFLGCTADEIYFTSGGSESDNQALLTAAKIGESCSKKHIISSCIEHHAILHTLDRLKKRGFEITLLSVRENGIIDPNELAMAIRNDTILVSIMYANNEIGTIQPIKELGKICRDKDVIFHTDAVQAVGHIPINVISDNVDMLSLSAHKFHGPKGIGALYVKKGISPARLVEGGPQEHNRRAGTENVPAIVGMSEALREAVGSMEQNSGSVIQMRDRLICGLLKIPCTVLNGDAYKRLPGNVSITIEGISGASLLFMLNQKGICASSGSACNSASAEPSHVLLSIGRSQNDARGTLRLSISDDNTFEEIEYIINTVQESVSFLRNKPMVEQGV